VSETNADLHEELAALPLPEGVAAAGEIDGLTAGLGRRVQRRGDRLGVTLRDVRLARRLYRLLAAAGREARLFLARSSSPRAGGAVVRVTWAAEHPERRPTGVRYARAFVRGATLACGYLADPTRGYSLEWNFDQGAERGARRLAACLTRLGVRFGSAAGRRGGVRLYVKGGEAVGDLLVQLEVGESLLRWEDARARRAMRGRIHREVNGEAANLRRAARAGVRQAEAARALLAADPALLPPALAEAARARLARPEATLEELGSALGLTKSGLNQRMRRLVALARAHGLVPEVRSSIDL
jgi:hypothetical protein